MAAQERQNMIGLKVPLKDAQKAKESKIISSAISKSHFPIKEDSFIFYPLSKKVTSKYELVKRDFQKKNERLNVKDSLAGKLGREEMDLLKTSMDVVGSIAILEIPEKLEAQSKIIADEVLKANKSIKTVLSKGRHSGEFRTRKLKFLSGEDTKIATYKENGCTLRVDVEKVYFSPRLSTERKRICSLVKKSENILIMGSGAGPYTCVLAKNTAAKQVIGVELNPEGHKFALDNIKLNKLKNAFSYCMDASKVAELKTKFDRIIMPMPTNAIDFLPAALKVASKGATIHLYDFELESEVSKGIDKINSVCSQEKSKCRMIGAVKAGMPAPRKYRYCYEFNLV